MKLKHAFGLAVGLALSSFAAPQAQAQEPVSDPIKGSHPAVEMLEEGLNVSLDGQRFEGRAGNFFKFSTANYDVAGDSSHISSAFINILDDGDGVLSEKDQVTTICGMNDVTGQFIDARFKDGNITIQESAAMPEGDGGSYSLTPVKETTVKTSSEAAKIFAKDFKL